MEPIDDPLRYAELLVRLIRPGGLLILAKPRHPSPPTEIPNLRMNILPHHLIRWNRGAFTACTATGLEVGVNTSPVSRRPRIILWLHRLLPGPTDPASPERYVARRWSCYASPTGGYELAKVISKSKTFPPGPRPIEALLVVCKPLP